MAMGVIGWGVIDDRLMDDMGAMCDVRCAMSDDGSWRSRWRWRWALGVVGAWGLGFWGCVLELNRHFSAAYCNTDDRVTKDVCGRHLDKREQRAESASSF
jgi:hypothetical protein